MFPSMTKDNPTSLIHSSNIYGLLYSKKQEQNYTEAISQCQKSYPQDKPFCKQPLQQ